MQSRTLRAFAPATISNFFSIHDEPLLSKDYSDLSHVGATGGGYILSKGVTTYATRLNGSDRRELKIVVNGDPTYPAKTTLTALRMLIEAAKPKFGTLLIEQQVDVPIGYGFGASAASAFSAVLAASSALGVTLSRRKVAYFAHAADIVSQTGLGTVSVLYSGAGVGAITKAGGPGVAKFLNVKVPKGLRIVTASLAPYHKSTALSSRRLRRKINAYGDEALREFEASPTLETLAEAGEEFSGRLGLRTKQVSKLIEVAKAHGALFASQNMIGYAVHALVMEPELEGVVSALGSVESMPQIDVYEVGTEVAGTRPVVETVLPVRVRTRAGS
jgi:pantoate kinase